MVGMTGEQMEVTFVTALPKMIRIADSENGGYMRGVNRASGGGLAQGESE